MQMSLYGNRKKIYIVHGDTYNGLPCEHVFNSLEEAERKYAEIDNLEYKAIVLEDEDGQRIIKRSANDTEGAVLNGHEN